MTTTYVPSTTVTHPLDAKALQWNVVTLPVVNLNATLPLVLVSSLQTTSDVMIINHLTLTSVGLLEHNIPVVTFQPPLST